MKPKSFFVGLASVIIFSKAISAAPIKSHVVGHAIAYRPHPERGSHVHIIVTPPGARGVDGRVLVEVYNRGKDPLALIQFDVTLNNHGGLAVSAPVKAEDLNSNMSGSQWIKIPMIKGKFPQIDSVLVENLRLVTKDAQEKKLPGFVDLVKN